ncbi:RpiR family glv operon transcriptional regulator [Clostridium beijerinckii]|uniref:MurR/RpiR family transcriptional regulator n=1 Tax=Clostridium beijerinckii TaxID=1520 RepID=UPI0014949212|nr:MurR/RpiR family transcriptional regulator [Clostridium beijerinckii]NOW86790.1 RpiR family glv operon transcriptional regulator [Clostridium beijerinckii]
MKLEKLINTNYNNLKPNDLYIWNFISNNKKECCSLTIDELALKCNISRTSIIRFAKRLGLSGYSELRLYLKLEEEKDPINKNENTVQSYINLMNMMIGEYGKQDFTKICKLLYESEKVFLYGTGAVQRTVAKELRRKFLVGHEHFYMIDGVDEIDSLCNTLTNHDLVFVISLNGKSDNAKEFSKQLLLKGVPFVSITSLSENDIAKYSTEKLYINTPEINIGTGDVYQILEMYFILSDILFLNFMNYKRIREHNYL